MRPPSGLFITCGLGVSAFEIVDFTCEPLREPNLLGVRSLLRFEVLELARDPPRPRSMLASSERSMSMLSRSGFVSSRFSISYCSASLSLTIASKSTSRHPYSSQS